MTSKLGGEPTLKKVKKKKIILNKQTVKEKVGRFYFRIFIQCFHLKMLTIFAFILFSQNFNDFKLCSSIIRKSANNKM